MKKSGLFSFSLGILDKPADIRLSVERGELGEKDDSSDGQW
jgi:hypothetical protein